MPEKGDIEVFSNPLPPSDHFKKPDEEDDDSHPLTNEDFRRMLMTPRSSSTGGYQSTIHAALNDQSKVEDEDDDPATRRQKKKSYYAKLKRIEEERQKELRDKYRDRAQERREGHNKDYEETEIISTTADYRAVAPDAKAGENYAERRKQVIQESKYLGGDMEHTHLVKGLDYALLEKVRAEITSKEMEDEDAMEKAVTQKKEEEENPEDKIQFKTKMAKSIYRTLFKVKTLERNELFLPKRMAYVVDLEDDFVESDVPTTLVRSKADCPSLEATTTLTTNDIVINKLTQILSYLRQGKREIKKMKKKDKGKIKDEDKLKEKLPGADDNIYGGIGEYIPSFSKQKEKKEKKDREKERDGYRDRDRERDTHRDRDRDRDREYRDRERDRRDRHRDDREKERQRDGQRDRERLDRDREKRKSYFEKPVEEDDVTKPGDSAKDIVKNINDRFKNYAEVVEDEKLKSVSKMEEDRMKKLKAKSEIDSYAECYPGMMESFDAFGDSDDEVDYTKMDQGNKKGPIGRWDFDTQEEYSDYMSNKEALPKAAFQYGVKMSDGRRTRRTGPKDEKAKLDRELQQINNIIKKRKVTGYEQGGKQPRY